MFTITRLTVIFPSMLLRFFLLLLKVVWPGAALLGICTNDPPAIAIHLVVSIW
jgi:hypothetical protein